MKHMGNRDYSLWDEQDGFFYDVLRYPDGRFHKFRVRSLVGLIPLFAVERLEDELDQAVQGVPAYLDWFLKNRRDLVRDVVHTSITRATPTHALTIVNQEQIGRMLARVLDPNEFLSDYGVRSLSKAHDEHPFDIRRQGRSATSRPRRSAKIKGGNSNWRGPIWFPTNFLLIESLRKLGKAFGRRRWPAGHAMASRSTNGSRNRQSNDRQLHATRTAAGPSSATRRSSRTTHTGATTCSSTNTSTATAARAWGRRIRRAGPA